MTRMTPWGALSSALMNRLQGEPPWGLAVYQGFVPHGTAQPYVVFSALSEFSPQRIRIGMGTQTLLLVKGISESEVSAESCAREIIRLLDDQGEQDITDNPVNAGSDWLISTITAERAITYTEWYADTQPFFHRGYEFRINMQTR